MGMLDGILNQIGSNVDIKAMAAKVGLTPEQVEQGVVALGAAHPQPGDTVGTAAATTGLPIDALQQMVAQIGGEGALGRFASVLGCAGGTAAAGGMLGSVSGMLDRDGDGNPLNDVGGMLGGLFGRKQ